MYGTDYAGRYQQAQVTSVEPKRLLLLVFEGGLRFLRRAQEAIQSGDVRAFGENLGRAQAVLAELQATLDHERGGTIATDLHRLYEFMLVHLAEANAHQSPRHVEEVRGLLETIAGAYRAIIDAPVASAA